MGREELKVEMGLGNAEGGKKRQDPFGALPFIYASCDLADSDLVCTFHWVFERNGNFENAIFIVR